MYDFGVATRGLGVGSTKVRAVSSVDAAGERGGNGSVDAEFSRFYEVEHAGQVRRATLLLGSESDAHDVVHAAFVAMFARWERIDQPGPYLSRAVLNGCRDVGRRRRSDAKVQRSIRPVDVTDIDDVLFDVLAELPFNQRAAVVLRFYVGMTEREIAEALDARPGSIGPWTTRALNRMREKLT